MPTATAHRALPYPQGIDVPDVPHWLQVLAEALDFDLFGITDAVRPAAGTAFRVHRDPATGAVSLDTGAAWVTIPTGGPFLPLTGGALSGALDLTAHELSGAIVVEERSKVTTVAAAGAARTLDAAVSPVHDVTLDQNVTFTLSGVDGDRLVLILRQPVALKTVAWPATVDWDTGLAPVQAASTAVVYRFVRVAGRWLGTPGAPIGSRGIRGRGTQSANTGNITAATDVPGMSVAVTPDAADREFEVLFSLSVMTASTNDSVSVQILVNGVVKREWHVCPPVPGIAHSGSFHYSYEPTFALQTIKVQIYRLSGVSTINTIMTQNRTGSISVKDVGVGQN